MVEESLLPIDGEVFLFRYKITIAYDGTNYCGWQSQASGLSIQTLVHKALTTVLRQSTPVFGSGRTDSGVHAKGQTAHFDASEIIDPSRLRLSLNALLPADVRILQLDPVLPDFHARFSAKSKIYHYHLHLDSVIDPFVRLYRYHVFGRCNIDRMKEALPFFLGTHDFTSFANEPVRTGGPCGKVRTLYHLNLIEQKGGIRLEFEGDGFLYKMVRNISETLVQVGLEKLPPNQIETIFLAKDRRAAPAAAPPQGLFLMEVKY